MIDQVGRGSTPLAGLLNKSSSDLVAYRQETLSRLAQASFDRYSLECPSCGNRAIIPSRDYLCSHCRQASVSG